jgi:FixJ family two-component response regulator
MRAMTGAFTRADRPKTVPRVVVVDDDASVREPLSQLIHSAGCQIGWVASAEEFLEFLPIAAPTCVLANLPLLALGDRDLQTHTREHAEIPVILMCEGIDVQGAVDAMKRGAFEVLTKPLMPETLLSTIRQALDRSRAALDQLAQVQMLQERYASLSARQREVMHLVVAGRLNKQAAGELGIAEYTVKMHRGNLMRKMGANSFAELVRMATVVG